ncbi:MAG TPA: amino acid adenylation domain-containing protein [Streptosporangiaceae bacterium]|nr:amino acid adenylation domain-containing protein [Streptosporangiaceae bacterium]
MNAGDLLRKLDDLGVNLILTGDRIRYRGSDSRLTPELLAEMKEHKQELITLLERRARLRWPPARQDPGQDRRGPLTRAQRTFWATDYFLNDGTYNLSGAIRLRGLLKDTAFTAALEDMRRLHPSLRTVFPVRAGEPVQHVLRAVPVPIERVDFAGRPLTECLRDCAQRADVKLPLSPRPPVRMRLYRLAEDDHIFFVTLHHIVADALSVRILVEDLARCYNARLSGVTADPPTGDLDMIDVARWEADRFAYADLAAGRRYWRERLSGAAFGRLPLPPPLQEQGTGHRGGAHSAAVDEATTAAVRQQAMRSRSSPFMVIAAAVVTILSRYTGRDDLVIGMPVGRRDRPGLEQLVGPLFDMVPVRLDAGGSPAFQDLIGRIRKAVLGAVGNAEVSASPQTSGRTAPDGAGRNLFNVILTDVGEKLPDPEFRGLDATHLDLPKLGAKYDMNFLIRDDGGTLDIEVEFDRQAVSEQDVAAMVEMTRRILADGVADPRRRTADLAAAPFGAAGAGAVGVPAAWTPGRDDSLPGRLAEIARERGDAVAVSHDGASLSYRALAERADRVARGLRRESQGIGDVVAVSLPRGIDLVVAILGAMGSGAASLVLDDSWPAARAERVLADAGARRVITTAPDPATGRTTVAELARLGEQAPPCAAVPACATAYTIYTSGSTGRPKGVHVTHANVLSLLGATGPGYGLGPGDVWTLFHSCSFDVAMYEMFGCLLHGGRLVVVPRWMTLEPEAFAGLLGREQVTILSQTPSALSVTLPAIARSPQAASRLRYVLLAGEKLDRWLADQWYQTVGDQAELVNMYGITETTVHASWLRVRPGDFHTAESDMGGPLPGTSLYLLHDNGTAAADRCVAEIYVGGPQVSAGYLGRPRETALRFVPDPFSEVPGTRMYRSGDLARRNGTALSYLGRRDSQVQVNGFRVELPEIEAALTAQPGVAAAGAAVTRDDVGSHVVAVVVGAAGAQPSPADLLRGLRAELPRYMLPRSIRVVPELPLTVNGKLDRAAVAASAAAPSTGTAASVPPSGPVAATLAKLFREVLRDPSISAASDFFDAGGDSMSAIRLVSLAAERGLEFTARDVYAAPRPADLATLAARVSTGERPERAPRAPFSLLPGADAGSFADDVVDAYPMTALQTGMLYHQEIAPDARVYHIVLSYRVRGRMEPEAFRAAAQQVVDAHPILRTSLDLGNAQGPVQRVHAWVPVPLRVEDIRHLDAAAQEARARQVLETETASDFDLARPGLFRLVVLIRSDEEYQLVFSHSHVILDGWSVNIFFGDLSAQYRDRLLGQAASPLPRPRTEFADYVALEQGASVDPAHREFWCAQAFAAAPLIAPDRAGPPAMRQVHLELPGVLSELHAVAATAGVPVKAVLCAAHLRVVAWLTGNDEVITSTVANCRPEGPEADRILGLFLNQLPLLAGLSGRSWTELARQVHQGELDMMPHRWYPNALIQRDFGPRPIFDSSFNFTNYHTTRELVRDGSIDFFGSDELEQTHYAFGTNYTVDVRTGELRLLLGYDESALSRQLAELAAQAHQRALSAIIADPGAACMDAKLPSVLDLARAMNARQSPATAAGATPHTSPLPAAQALSVAGNVLAQERAADAAAPAAFPERAAALERQVRTVWEEVLGPGDVGQEASFFDAGGDSIAAMRLVNRLRAEHGALSMGTFLREPTIAGLVRALSMRADGHQTPAPAPAPAPAGGPRSYPLSRAQRQMWSIVSRLPDLPLFGMPGALRVDGPLDLGLLTATLSSLVRRHEALRTRILANGSEPCQVIEPDAEPSVEHVDLSGQTAPLAVCERLMAAAVRKPIRLDHAPLMRVVVYRISDKLHVIYLNIHHIVCDGWSLSLLLREAERTYRALAVGAGGPDLPQAPGYGELVLAQLAWERSPEAERDRAYWAQRLAPPWPRLSAGPESRFPDAGQVPLARQLRSATCQRRLDRATRASVRAAARRHGLTDFMVVATGYAAALRSWSAQRDVRIGTILANRAQPGADQVVGLVANTAVLRLDVAADAGPAGLSRQVRDVCIDAHDHQDLVFEDILGVLNTRYPAAERTGPLFEAMLVMQEEIAAVDPAEDLKFSPYRVEGNLLGAPVAVTTCDFLLNVAPSDGELVLTLQYRPAMTDSAVAAGFLDDIVATLATTAEALGQCP